VSCGWTAYIPLGALTTSEFHGPASRDREHSVLILVGATIGYGALALGYSLLQWSYAVRFRREWIKAEHPRRPEARDRGEPKAVDVIVPCYNEQPEVLKACCTALERQRRHYPGQIHVWLVDDGSQMIAALEPVYRRFEALPGWTVIRHPRNRGKRRAQDSAFQLGTGALVVTVDSDTTLAATCIARLVAAMARNPKAGTISGHVRARNAGTSRLTALIDQRYEFLFRQERAAQSWHRAVTCCSGPVSIYRRPVLTEIWHRYVEDTFLGRQRHFGDDLKLSLLVLEQTYDSLYWPTAKAWTIVPDTLRGYARQQVRWNKSYYRELRRTDQALRKHLSFGYLGLRRSPFLGLPTGHRYLRFELAARVLLPLLPPVLLGGSAWAALTGRDDLRWVPLLVMVTVMLLLLTAIGLQARSWSFPLLYAPLHLVMLLFVRVRALLTLGNSRWGTRDVLRPWRTVKREPSADPVGARPAPGRPVAERTGS
jgi:cellulose synthase/poly-beta-1,6-N-acetylglucosamine synthase-like glycosyltransferase